MTTRHSTGLRNLMLSTAGFTEIFANGIIEIYSGAQPASADNAATGTLLGTVTKAGGAFTPGTSTNGLTWGTPSAGVVSKSTDLWQFTGVAAGTAGWFRLKGNALDDNLSSTTLPRLDGSIASSGGDMRVATVSIVTGAPNAVHIFKLTLPATCGQRSIASFANGIIDTVTSGPASASCPCPCTTPAAWRRARTCPWPAPCPCRGGCSGGAVRTPERPRCCRRCPPTRRSRRP